MKALLVFDFGANEEAAQKARHRLEGWKQGFRLGNKLTLKFERQAPKEAAENSSGEEQGAKERSDGADGGNILVAVRLDFSAHEKLSYHRWLERIPDEDPFKGISHEAVLEGTDGFEKRAEWFDSLT